MIAVGVSTALLVLGSMAIDEGEVVTLVTTDSEGYAHETELWVAEIDGHSYLRSGGPDTHWLGRLRDEPLVELRRNGSGERFRASVVTDPALRARVNAAMAEKYGTADRLWGLWSDRSHSVPVALEPAPPPAGGERPGAS